MNNPTSSEQRVQEGIVWDEFCDRLKALGKVIQRAETPNTPFDKAEGYRYLTRLLRGGLESFIEASDPDSPVLRCVCHESIKIGADNPDNYYQSCVLNARNDYRLYGTRGTVHYLSFGTQSGGYGKTGGLEPTGALNAQDLQIDENGSFEIILSAKKHEGNWLPMSDESNQLIVRQTFRDRRAEQRAELKIERVGAQGGSTPLTAEKLDKSLRRVTQFVEGTSSVFADWAQSYLEHINELPPADQNLCQMAGGDPRIYYFHSAWQLDHDDDALVIVTPPIPECDMWNFQLDNYWMESLDYVNHTIHINKFTAEYEPDGSARIIVAHRDPQRPNWVQTAGHRFGTMCFRWIGAEEHPPLQTHVERLQ